MRGRSLTGAGSVSLCCIVLSLSNGFWLAFAPAVIVSNTISVEMLANGENVIYAKIKMTGKQKEFMKDYIDRKENK